MSCSSFNMATVFLSFLFWSSLVKSVTATDVKENVLKKKKQETG
jgi:hypothetical protein